MKLSTTLLLSTLTAGCASVTPGVRGAPSPSTSMHMQGEGPSGAPREALAWAELGPAAFARAKAEGRLVVIDGAAEWCHWCHVMEATTYHDAGVRSLLDARFIAAKVDVSLAMVTPDLIAITAVATTQLLGDAVGSILNPAVT